MTERNGIAAGKGERTAEAICLVILHLFHSPVSTFTLRASPQIQPRSSSQWETSIPVDQRLAAALPLISQGSSPVSKGACTTGSPWMGGVSTRPQNRCNEGTFYIFWKAHPQSRVCSSVACFRILRAHRDGRCQRIPLRKKCPSQKRS